MLILKYRIVKNISIYHTIDQMVNSLMETVEKLIIPDFVWGAIAINIIQYSFPE